MRRKTFWEIQSGRSRPDPITRAEAIMFVRTAIFTAAGMIAIAACVLAFTLIFSTPR
jgi:hypothetical protein